MIFLTYNDNYNGIYKSQVIDVCCFLQKEFLIKVKLIAIVSIRSYREQKRNIVKNYPNSIVLPMIPKVRFWKLNTFTLALVCLFSWERKIWARGVFASNIAIYIKKIKLAKVVLFDARGAYQAEFTEYNVLEDEKVKGYIEQIEKRALIESDIQLAVSNRLIEWWKSKYNFQPVRYSLIPCTLSSFFYNDFVTEQYRLSQREKWGYIDDDIILVYSGSSAGWQSFKLVDDFLFDMFSVNPYAKLIFLSNEIPNESKIFKTYSDRVLRKWLRPEEVNSLLTIADYGLLIREQSITNRVASPVKFAEYLASGLQVIISQGIGDFTDFVNEHKCGQVLEKEIKLEKVSFSQKIKNNQLAKKYFLKEAVVNKQAYKKLIEAIN